MLQSEALKMPTRVSRLYPLFALAFLLTTAALFYNWQYQTINSESTYFKQNRTIEQLQAEVASLKKNQEADQAKLAAQQTKIDAAGIQLKELEAKLASKESELESAAAKLKNQEAQLATNATELERLRTRPPLFSFQNKSSLSDFDAKKEAVKEVVSAAYDTIQDLYGKPYLLNSVTITFVDTFTISGSSGEIVIENGPNGISVDIHLKDFEASSFEDTNTIIHEMIHSFHGVAVLDSSAFEEGMTVAAADVVMQRMIAAGKIPAFSELYLTISPEQYTSWNQTLTVHADSSKFYGDRSVSRVYQLIGTAWMRFYQEDPAFFKKLNDAYYPLVQNGEVPDDTLIREQISAILPSVGGVPVATYLAENRAFNPS